MKNYTAFNLCFLLGCFTFFYSGAQPTFLKRLSFNYLPSNQYTHPEDSVLHLLDFEKGLNGDVFLLASTVRGSSTIYKMDSAGNILWSTYGGYNGGLSKSWVSGIAATPDGGCVFGHIFLSWQANWTSTASLVKVDGMGNVEWSMPLQSSMQGMMYQEIYDVSIAANNYVCLAMDSIHIITPTTLLSGKLPYSGPGSLTGFQNGDILVQSQGFTGRIDQNGNPLFSLQGTVLTKDTSIYEVIGNFLREVDGQSGQAVDSVPFTNTGLNNHLMLADNGWISYDPDTLIRFDANGGLKWSRGFDSLPLFGINKIGELADGSLLTGGTYKSTNYWFVLQGTDYSFFLTSIDSLGQSVIDSTSQVFAGDANDDNVFEFGDLIFMSLASGSTGPPRTDSVQTMPPYDMGDIAIDFAGSFGTGINHKQSDFDGNGIVDTTDISLAGYHTINYFVITTPWKTTGKTSPVPVQSSATPIFTCVPEKDSVFSGDTLRFYFIAGDTSQFIDSIYGYAFQYFMSSQTGVLLDVQPLNSSLGSLNDLYTFSYFNQYHANLVAGRIDKQNVLNFHDTLAYADFLITGNTAFSDSLILISLKLITSSGHEIPIHSQSLPFSLNPVQTGIEDFGLLNLTVFPTVTRNKITISNQSLKAITFEFSDSRGKIFNSGNILEKSNLVIEAGRLTPGVYLLILSDGHLKETRKVVVQ